MAENESDIAEKAKEILENLLDKMGISARVEPYEASFVEEHEGETKPIAFDIRGDDLGILIGRRGLALDSLQYLVRVIINSQTKTWVPIIIDIEGYKQRRYESLQALAYRIAEQVKTRKSPFRLEPMPPFERRVIHLALANHPDVATESIGEGEARRVVVSPKKRL